MTMRARTFGGVVLAGALLAAGSTAAAVVPHTPPRQHMAADSAYSAAELRRDVARVRQAGGGDVNVVARVDRPGGALQARSGTAAAGSAAPVPWGAEFRIASTTKTFVAVVVLQLAAEKRLSLDDTVEHWLPGTVSGHGNDGRRITVRDLLRQTSGLFNYTEDPGIQRLLQHPDANRYNDTPPAELVAIAMKHPPLFTPRPGGRPRWAYSNTNYLLAAMIAEKAGRTDWRELVEHRVIAGLGLRHTSIPGANPFLPEPHARVYLTTADGARLDITDHSFQHTADSGIVSTTADLDTFFRGLADGKLLPAAQWHEMRQTVRRTDDPEDIKEQPLGDYGLGLRTIPLSCAGSYYTHEGDGPGVYTRPAVTADGRRAVTVSITTTSAPADLPTLNRATNTLIDHALCGDTD
ncbi:D-alanyl-D-alanine carboxypeptidase [Streptomyces griseochromogenes]|uniref:D-alanyl-D-alanine carboxypeptidase n=1 Tax=Streptomyces griseochromogenes TaxID=68214 RepID=A0A1B1B2B3_9ACTN|nr:serine hydrolase domain-containing protein [Streptomyces griseochromogenes]ANP52950.1 serine hydrolase [Streptomyces griseochromogenes]MBP2047594.1 D-alanyl-D-alanine carboxypeptidase [Streptomyces griseochromogenes]